MAFLRNAWYAAMWSQDLSIEKFVPRIIAGEPILFLRKEGGGVSALRDICPHRFAPLHLGQRLPGDKIRCAYHGLEFDDSGLCVRNPHGSEKIASANRVRSFAAVEKHTVVWVWIGEENADPARIPDFSCLDEDPTGFSVGRRDMIRISASYRLVADNLLDLSHAPFLHAGVIGNAETVKADIKVEQDGDYVLVHRPKYNVRPAALLDRLYMDDGQPANIWSTIRWSAPSNILNDTGCYPLDGQRSDGAGILGVHLITPETDETCFYHFCWARSGKIMRPDKDNEALREWVSDARRHAFEKEDGPVIDRQHMTIKTYPEMTSRPVLLETDAGPALCNRRLDALMKAERSVATS